MTTSLLYDPDTRDAVLLAIGVLGSYVAVHSGNSLMMLTPIPVLGFVAYRVMSRIVDHLSDNHGRATVEHRT